MSLTSRTHEAGFPIFTLTDRDSEVVISAFGGQILSWTNNGVPIVFENRDRAIVDGKTAYRGGAPICFPYFGAGSLLPLGTTLEPKHGEARTTVWESNIVESDNAVVLKTTQPAGEGYGPTTFFCELTYRLHEGLNIFATISNTGQNAAPFQFAVHTYWAATKPSEARITGLGNRHLDNLRGLTEHREDDSSQPHPTPIDRIYLDSAPDLELATESHRVEIKTEGTSGSVVWNPGPNHDLKDLGSPDFLCLESGVIVSPIDLQPGARHEVRIVYRAILHGAGS